MDLYSLSKSASGEFLAIIAVLEIINFECGSIIYRHFKENQPAKLLYLISYHRLLNDTV